MLSAGAVVTPLTALACDWAGGVTVRPPRPHLSPGGSDEMSRRVFPPLTVPCLQVSAAARLPLAAGRPSLSEPLLSFLLLWAPRGRAFKELRGARERHLSRPALY